MKKILLLCIVSLAVLTLACEPVKPEEKGTALDVAEAGLYIAPAMSSLTSEDYANATSETTTSIKDGVETQTTTTTIRGADATVEMKIVGEQSVEAEVAKLNGEIKIDYDFKSATIVLDDVANIDGILGGSVWYIPSDGEGFYIEDSSLLSTLLTPFADLFESVS